MYKVKEVVSMTARHIRHIHCAPHIIAALTFALCAAVLGGCKKEEPHIDDTRLSSVQTSSEKAAKNEAKGAEDKKDSTDAIAQIEDDTDAVSGGQTEPTEQVVPQTEPDPEIQQPADLSNTEEQVVPVNTDPTPHQGAIVYDVDTLLAQASDLEGQRVLVIGDLPQTLAQGPDGNLEMVLYSPNGTRLRLKGHVGIGSCEARIGGTLCFDEYGPYVQVDDYAPLLMQ